MAAVAHDAAVSGTIVGIALEIPPLSCSNLAFCLRRSISAQNANDPVTAVECASISEDLIYLLTIARTFTAAAVVAGTLSYSADGIEADQPGARTRQVSAAPTAPLAVDFRSTGTSSRGPPAPGT